MLLGVRLIEKLARFEVCDLKACFPEQEMYFFGCVFTVMTGFGFFTRLAGKNVGREETGMVAVEDSVDGAMGGDIGSGKQKRATRLENAVDLRHHVHRIGR